MLLTIKPGDAEGAGGADGARSSGITRGSARWASAGGSDSSDYDTSVS